MSCGRELSTNKQILLLDLFKPIKITLFITGYLVKIKSCIWTRRGHT